MSVVRSVHRARVVSLALLLLATGGCRHAGQSFLWIEDVPKGMYVADPTYQIAPGDVIGVRVLGQEGTSVERVRVRDDGKISMPFLNDLAVAGTEPEDLARRIEVKLKAFLVAPTVTVVVHERRPLRVAVLGKVVRPGVYDLDRGAGVVHALAAAGGITPFADDDGIFVIRSGYWADGNPAPARIRFRYGDLLAGRVPAALFMMIVGDVVVAE